MKMVKEGGELLLMVRVRDGRKSVAEKASITQINS